MVCCVVSLGPYRGLVLVSDASNKSRSPPRHCASLHRTGTVRMHKSTIARHVVEVLVVASYVGILAPLVDFILWSAIAGHLLCLWLANSVYIAFSVGRSVMCVMGGAASICSNCYHDLRLLFVIARIVRLLLLKHF